MKRIVVSGFILFVVLSVAVPGLAAVKNGPHDFSTNSTYAANTGTGTGATAEQCKACHVPHKAQTANSVITGTTSGGKSFGDLLWKQDYAGANGASIASNWGNTNDPSVLLCMGCHDGQVAASIGMPSGSNAIIDGTAGSHPVNVILPPPSPGQWKTPQLLAGVISSNQKVTCATCHDPHSSNPNLLRINNAGSALCTDCHDK